MHHYTDDELTLLFYGEARRPSAMRSHLQHCGHCARLYAEITSTLTLISPAAIPARDDRYGLEVWHRIRTRLPERESARAWGLWPRIGAGAAVAATLVAAFAVGRLSLGSVDVWPSTAPAGMLSADVSTRVRSVAIVEHLEQSERVLLELVNASAADGANLDVAPRQAHVEALIDANRFYRHASRNAGDTVVADVLDDLERSLLDIAHGPSSLTASDLDVIRTRLDTASVIFKVRVLTDELDDPAPAPASPSATRETI